MSQNTHMNRCTHNRGVCARHIPQTRQNDPGLHSLPYQHAENIAQAQLSQHLHTDYHSGSLLFILLPGHVFFELVLYMALSFGHVLPGLLKNLNVPRSGCWLLVPREKVIIAKMVDNAGRPHLCVEDRLIFCFVLLPCRQAVSWSNNEVGESKERRAHQA